MNTCNVCGSDQVSALSEVETIHYKGQPLAVDMAYSLCQSCGVEFVATDQIRANDRAVIAAKRRADHLLTPEEIRQARAVLGLSQEKAAEMFGGGRNAFSKYERGEVAQSVAMDRLIRVCMSHPSLLDELRDHHAGHKVVNRMPEVISLMDWQLASTAVNDAVFHVSNAVKRSFTVMPEQDVAYGS